MTINLNDACVWVIGIKEKGTAKFCSFAEFSFFSYFTYFPLIAIRRNDSKSCSQNDKFKTLLCERVCILANSVN